MAYLLIAHAGACLLWVLFTKWEVAENAALIAANGPADTLKERFHAGRTWLRAGVAVGLALVANVYTIWHNVNTFSVCAYGVYTLGLLALFTGWFTYRFSPALNLARGKPAGYVSADSHAAFFDRTLTRWGIGLLGAVRLVLAVGVAVYGLSMGFVYWCRM